MTAYCILSEVVALDNMAEFTERKPVYWIGTVYALLQERSSVLFRNNLSIPEAHMTTNIAGDHQQQDKKRISPILYQFVLIKAKEIAKTYPFKLLKWNSDMHQLYPCKAAHWRLWARPAIRLPCVWLSWLVLSHGKDHTWYKEKNRCWEFTAYTYLLNITVSYSKSEH